VICGQGYRHTCQCRTKSLSWSASLITKSISMAVLLLSSCLGCIQCCTSSVLLHLWSCPSLLEVWRIRTWGAEIGYNSKTGTKHNRGPWWSFQAFAISNLAFPLLKTSVYMVLEEHWRVDGEELGFFLSDHEPGGLGNRSRWQQQETARCPGSLYQQYDPWQPKASTLRVSLLWGPHTASTAFHSPPY